MSKKHFPGRTRELYVKGLCMGVADVIPGISGGTIALILGLYEELIDVIHGLELNTALALCKHGLRFWQKDQRLAAKTAFLKLRLDFLLPLITGILTAVVIASHIIPPLMARYPMQMKALFMGLILASIYIPFSLIKRLSWSTWIMVLLFSCAAYYLVGLPGLQSEQDLYTVFFCGAIAICAMILPGISGSYMLQALGHYEYVLRHLHLALHANIDGIIVISIFLCGIFIGITSFIRILFFSLHKYHDITLAALTGLMIGSLRAVWPFRDALNQNNILPHALGSFELQCLVLVSLGAAITILLITLDRRIRVEEKSE